MFWNNWNSSLVMLDIWVGERMSEEKLNSLTREEAIYYLDNQMDYTYQLRQENQQLKEQLEKKYKTIGTLTNEILYEENTKLLSVLDEIREYIKEHNDYLEKAKEMYIGCNDELLKSTCIQLINNELVRSDNLLQILDKVKE